MEATEQSVNSAGTAGVIARPPLLFLAALLLGFILVHLLPLVFPISRASPAHWVSATIAAFMMLGGVTLALAAIRNFTEAATPVPTNQPTRTLVTSGLHGWTRNPIYVGILLVYLGIGLVVRSPWIMLLAVPLAIIIHYGVIAREEAYLEERFGDAYRDYKTRVRRWL